MKTKHKSLGSYLPNPNSILLATLSISLAFFSRPVLAQDHQLVLTEISSTSLSVLYDGASAGITVSPNGADSWLVTFPTTTHLGLELDWQEPEDPTLVNDFNIYHPDIGVSNTWIVSSEFTLPGGPTQDSAQPADGHTFAMIGGDFLDNQPIDMTFHDLAADTAAVPEPGSLLTAMSLAVAVLCTELRRRAKKRRA